MRKTLLIPVFVFAALACNAILPAPLPQTEADVPRVSAADAKAAFDSGQAIIVDVRGAEFFAQEHIAGAVNIPLVNIENNPAGVDLDKGQWIITYCT